MLLTVLSKSTSSMTETFLLALIRFKVAAVYKTTIENDLGIEGVLFSTHCDILTQTEQQRRSFKFYYLIKDKLKP